MRVCVLVVFLALRVASPLVIVILGLEGHEEQAGACAKQQCHDDCLRGVLRVCVYVRV